jgi:hypothetical protein
MLYFQGSRRKPRSRAALFLERGFMFTENSISFCEFEEIDHGDRWEIKMVVPKGADDDSVPAGKVVGPEAYFVQVVYIMTAAAGLAESCGLGWVETVLQDAIERITTKVESAREYVS